jgi:hypothetical protein
MGTMDDKRAMLGHFLGALAYRTQKALRGCPESFGDFDAGNRTRSPKALVRHMTSVLGYSRTFFVGGRYWPDELPTFADEIARFHEMLASVKQHLDDGSPLNGITEEQMLQGPFSDAMTHAGQLAMLRRLAGIPVPPENFIEAEISADNVSANQPEPKAPDKEWPESQIEG